MGESVLLTQRVRKAFTRDVLSRPPPYQGGDRGGRVILLTELTTHVKIHSDGIQQ